MLVFTSYLKNKFGKTIYLTKRVIQFIMKKNKSNMRRKTSGEKVRGNLVKKRISAKDKVYYNWNSLYNITQ